MRARESLCTGKGSDKCLLVNHEWKGPQSGGKWVTHSLSLVIFVSSPPGACAQPTPKLSCAVDLRANILTWIMDTQAVRQSHTARAFTPSNTLKNVNPPTPRAHTRYNALYIYIHFTYTCRHIHIVYSIHIRKDGNILILVQVQTRHYIIHKHIVYTYAPTGISSYLSKLIPVCHELLKSDPYFIKHENQYIEFF
jgi:hypothetical protein